MRQSIALSCPRGRVARPKVETFLPWARQVPEPKGPIDFGRYRLHLELFRALADPAFREVVVMKGTQIGASAGAVRATLWLARQGNTVIYLLPTQRHASEFADTRVEPLLAALGIGRGDGVSAVRNKRLKWVERGWAHFRGADSTFDLITIDADVLFFDEFDFMKPRNVAIAERRVSGSPLHLLRYISTPSHPEGPIALRWEASDKRQWLLKCTYCRDEQSINFFDNVFWVEDKRGRPTEERIVCRRCQEPLDVRTGRWVAEAPESDIVGYHIHRLLDPLCDLRSIILTSKKREPWEVQAFKNTDLGIPHADETTGIDRRAVQEAQELADVHVGRYTVPRLRVADGLVTMGVDAASVRSSTVRISQYVAGRDGSIRKVALFIGEVASLSELGALMNRFEVNLACIDHLPEGQLAREFASSFPGRVWIVKYSGNQIDSYSFDRDQCEVTVQRNAAIEEMVAGFRAGKNLLPTELPDGYADQLVRPHRIVAKDEEGRIRVKWIAHGATDYFHCEVYDEVAFKVWQWQDKLAELQRVEYVSLNPQWLESISDYDEEDELEFDPNWHDRFLHRQLKALRQDPLLWDGYGWTR